MRKVFSTSHVHLDIVDNESWSRRVDRLLMFLIYPASTSDRTIVANINRVLSAMGATDFVHRGTDRQDGIMAVSREGMVMRRLIFTGDYSEQLNGARPRDPFNIPRTTGHREDKGYAAAHKVIRNQNADFLTALARGIS